MYERHGSPCQCAMCHPETAVVATPAQVAQQVKLSPADDVAFDMWLSSDGDQTIEEFCDARNASGIPHFVTTRSVDIMSNPLAVKSTRVFPGIVTYHETRPTLSPVQAAQSVAVSAGVFNPDYFDIVGCVIAPLPGGVVLREIH